MKRIFALVVIALLIVTGINEASGFLMWLGIYGAANLAVLGFLAGLPK